MRPSEFIKTYWWFVLGMALLSIINLNKLVGYFVYPKYINVSNCTTFWAIEDTYIVKHFPNRNYGSNVAVLIGKYSELAFFKFNLSLPEEAIIDNVTFHFGIYRGKEYVERTRYKIYFPLADWREHTLTWNNKPDLKYITTSERGVLKDETCGKFNRPTGFFRWYGAVNESIVFQTTTHYVEVISTEGALDLGLDCAPRLVVCYYETRRV